MQELGLAESNLDRSQKRRLVREMSRVKTLLEIRSGIQHLSAESIVRQVARLVDVPPHLASRAVHEAGLTSGDTDASEKNVRSLVRDLHNVADPAALARVGTDFSDHAVQRFLASQLIGQAAPISDLHRVLSVLATDTEDGVLGRAAWGDLLGMDLTDLILGVMGMPGLIATDGIIEPTKLSELPQSLVDIVTGSINLLGANLGDIRSIVQPEEDRLKEDVIRGLGPLVQRPLIRLEDDRVVVPSQAHLAAAVSTAGLYIRLLRADGADKSRARSGAVGVSFEGYLQAISSEALTHDWFVMDLDEGAEPDESRADLLLVPPAGDFVLIVESKTTLQALDGQLRAWENRRLVDDLYQPAFDQIDASARTFAEDDVPVFGLVVTLDRHITTRIDGRTYLGVPIGGVTPTTPSASSNTPSRVISAQDFEDLIEVLAGGAADPAVLRAALYDDGSSMNVTERIRGGSPSESTDGSLSDRLRVAALHRLATAVDDDALSATLRATTR